MTKHSFFAVIGRLQIIMFSRIYKSNIHGVSARTRNSKKRSKSHPVMLKIVRARKAFGIMILRESLVK